MKAKTLISTTVFIACIFASCAPVIKAKPTETPTPASQPVLIAYTLSVDGGDELVNCLAGSNQPQFILFANGQLIIYKNGQYWESALSQNETALLMNKIENTGILRLGEIEADGFAELIVKGKVYHFSHVNYPAKPIEQVVKIINQYQPDSPKHYVPENLLLWIYPVESVAQFEEYLPKPIPPTKDWSKDLKSLSEFGEGFRNLSLEMDKPAQVMRCGIRTLKIEKQ